MTQRITLREVFSRLNEKRHVRNLRELARQLKVPYQKLRVWRKDSPALMAGHPYDLGKCALELAFAKRIPRNRLFSADSPISEPFTNFILEAAVAGEFAEELEETLSMISREGPIAHGDVNEDFIKNLIVRSCAQTKNPPAINQTAVVAIGSPKTAALFADRVWCLDRTAPAEISFSTGTLEELCLKGISKAFLTHIFCMRSTEHFPEKLKASTIEDLVPKIETQVFVQAEGALGSLLSTVLCSVFAKRSGLHITPFTASNDAYENVYEPGNFRVLSFAFDAIPVVVEESLEWEQVLDIRHDEESRIKLQRFLHWLDTEMEGKEATFVRDEIAIRLADYRDALNKHGVRVNLGCLKTLTDYRVATASSAVLAAGHFSEFANSLTAGIVAVVHGASALVASRSIALDLTAERSQNPVAYLHSLPQTKKLSGLDL